MPSWSHSSLKQYDTCPRQYHEVRVLKKYPREDTAATIYGTQLHEQCELYLRDGKPVDPAFNFLEPTLESINKMPGTKYAEHEMAVTYDLKPCEFKSKQAWCRGIADVLVVDSFLGTARVMDFKTGGNKYPDVSQLTLMSLLVFKHFPEVQKVSSALLFVLKNTVVKHVVERKKEEELWWKYRQDVAKIDASLDNGVWNPKPSGLCRQYCPVLTCHHNGRN